MAFCRQCGQQIKDGDPFCTLCGASQNGSTPKASMAVNNDRINDIINIVLGMLLKPISTIRTVCRLEFTSFAILGGAIAVLTGLLAMWMTSAIGNFIMDIIGFGSFSSIRGEIPWGQIFAYSLISTLAVMLGQYLGMFLIGKLMFKSESASTPYLNVAVASSVPTTAAMIIAIILAYIYTPLGLLVLYLGMMVSLVCVYFGTKQIVNGDDDKLVYALPLIYLIMYIVLYLVTRILFSL